MKKQFSSWQNLSNFITILFSSLEIFARKFGKMGEKNKVYLGKKYIEFYFFLNRDQKRRLGAVRKNNELHSKHWIPNKWIWHEEDIPTDQKKYQFTNKSIILGRYHKYSNSSIKKMGDDKKNVLIFFWGLILSLPKEPSRPSICLMLRRTKISLLKNTQREREVEKNNLSVRGNALLFPH